MATSFKSKTFKPVRSPNLLTALPSRYLNSVATAHEPRADGPSSSFTFGDKGKDKEDSIYVKAPDSTAKTETALSVTMPMVFMTGSIVGKRFYKKVTTRESDDGLGWSVMLDYRTLKTPSKRPLKLPTLALAKAIAAEWEYQIPLYWLTSEFGFKPIVYSSFFGGKQEDGLINAVESVLKKTDVCELAAIDAIAAAAHSLVIALGIFHGKLQIDEAIELIRIEEDLQVDRWGLVEGGHDVDIADLKVQIASATVFLGLSRRI